MTSLLLTALGVTFVYAVYIATASASAARQPADFLDGGLSIPAWGYIFGGAGIVVAGLGLEDHLLLIANYGLQYNHVALGLILAALAGTLVHKQLWLTSRLTGLRTAGQLLGTYYASTAIRLYVLLVALLFALPFAASLLAETGALLEQATGGALPAGLVIWGSAFFLGLYAIVGGWRAMVYVVAAQTLATLVLLIVTTGTIGLSFQGLALTAHGIAVPAGIAGDRLPGVIQFTAGLGKTVPSGGLWTTTQILSFAIALAGITLSPGFALLGVSVKGRTVFAFNQVWMVAGLATGLLVFLGPLIGAELATGSRPTLDAITRFASRLAGSDELLGVGFLFALVLSQQIAVGFFVTSGASILTTDFVVRYLRPGLTGSGERTAARIAIALLFVAVASLATFAPLPASLLSTLTLSLSAQLLPAYLGLCWLPWISRSGVVTGLVFGLLFVLFCEPPGLVAFEGLFLDLPWGRWPLTIHSAAWGLFFNLGFCVIVSLWTRREAEREYRDRLHDELARSSPAVLGGRATTAAKWSLTLIWAFFALGPGAILGNTLFSRQTFGGAGLSAGVPSLLVWQVAAWFSGVLLVWWLAYPSRLGVIDAVPSRRLQLGPIQVPQGSLSAPQRPDWITRSLSRLTRRSGTDNRQLPHVRPPGPSRT